MSYNNERDCRLAYEVMPQIPRQKLELEMVAPCAMRIISYQDFSTWVRSEYDRNANKKQIHNKTNFESKYEI